MKVIVHPECKWEVVQKADMAGSTAYIVNQVKAAPPGTVWSIGTEVHLVNRLANEVAPDRIVHSLDQFGCLCSTMFRVSPNHLLWILEGLVNGEIHNQIVVPEPIKANAKLAQVEQVKKFVILDHDLSQETGELTPTLKVKRNVVNEKYAPLFDELYAG